MKKSRQIQLVLISAAFVSCNPVIIPHYAISTINIDSSLTQNNGVLSAIYCECNQEYVSNMTRQSAGSGPILISAIQHSNAFLAPYRMNSVWEKKKFIQRGGFGSTMFTVAS